MKKRRLLDILPAIIIGSSIIALGFGAVLMYGGGSFLGLATSKGKLQATDFETLKVPEDRASYLVCPSFLCLASEPHQETPIYNLPVRRLRARLLEFIDQQPDIRTRLIDPAKNQYEFVSQDLSMRFPHAISVRFFELSSSSSTVAIYSQSVFDEERPNQHMRRAQRWLDILKSAEISSQ